MEKPSLNQLMEHIRQLVPHASIDEDLEGQLVIYTNLAQKTQNDNDPLTDFDPGNS